MNNLIENNKWSKSNKWHCDKCNKDYHPTYKYTHLKSKMHITGVKPSELSKELKQQISLKKYYDKNQEKLVQYQKEFYYANHEKNKQLGREYKQRYRQKKYEKEYKSLLESIKNEPESIQKNSLEFRLKEIKNKIIKYSNKWEISSELSTSLKANE